MQPFTGSDEDAIRELDTRLRRAVKMRMVSDVPLGAFLSGGIDSSMIVALMQAQSDRPVKTFTIGFEDAAYNEANDARAVATHLGTEHTELYVSHSDVLGVIRAWHTSTTSRLRTPRRFLLSLCRNWRDRKSLSVCPVTVVTSCWGIQPPHVGTPHLVQDRLDANGPTKSHRCWHPLSFANDVEQFIQRIGTGSSKRDASTLAGVQAAQTGRRMPSRDEAVLYTLLTAHWSEPQKVVLGASDAVSTRSLAANWPDLVGFEQNSMLMDVLGYLPNDILVKLDRASMAVSLEGRVPFLDPDVFAFAWRLPLGMKIRKGQGKWVLRQLLDKYVPRRLFERPKMGFGIPIESYLRGPLRDWAEALLSERRIREVGLLAPELIRQRWSEHLSGRKDWQYHIWDVLMLQSWLDENRGQTAAPQAVQAEVARS